MLIQTTGSPLKVNTLSQYEQKQMEAIARWRAASPGIASRTFSRVSTPASRAVGKMLPPSVMQGALELVQNAAERLSDRQSIFKRAGVQNLAQLAEGNLERCDRASYAVNMRSTLLAGGTGMAYGMMGAAGMALDIPTLLVLSFRAIHRVGLCYGEDLREKPRLVLALFSLSSADSLEEKRAAIEMIERETGSAGLSEWLTGVERAAELEFAKEAARLSLHNLSQQFAKRLGMRMAGGLLPVIGAGVGGSVNAWYVHEVAEAAKRSFQWRWLRRRTPGLHLPEALDG